MVLAKVVEAKFMKIYEVQITHCSLAKHAYRSIVWQSMPTEVQFGKACLQKYSLAKHAYRSIVWQSMPTEVIATCYFNMCLQPSCYVRQPLVSLLTENRRLHI